MIKSLFIKNYAIIEEVNLEFSQGYNAITGETGAGKSILLGALSLIYGKRADTRVLYNAEAKCTVEAHFEVPSTIIKQLKNKIEVDFEDEEIIIRREISSSGKSRAFVNDTPVRLYDLRNISEHIFDIHNQFDTLSITTPEYQLFIIDTVAGNSEEREHYKNAFNTYTTLKNEVKQLERFKQKNLTDLEFNKYQLEELEKLELDNIVKSELMSEFNTLENSERILQALSQLIFEIHEADHAVVNRLTQFSREIGSLSDVNPQMNEIFENLNEAIEHLNDIDFLANRLREKMNMSEDRLEEVSDVLDHLNKLEQKHNTSSLEELIVLREQFRMSVSQTENIDDILNEKKKLLQSSMEELKSHAKALSTSRQKVFESLSNALEKSLTSLAIPHARIEINHGLKQDHDPSGIDEISFSFSANKGIDPNPVDQVASGGELSRLALSVKSLIADQYEVPCLIFDEIDTGISGAVAQRVGEIFLDIADNRQVICITHSPQVASLAQKHFLVEKRDTDQRTITHVKELEGDERILALAKMLSTDPPTPSAIENAKELLLLATH